MHSKSSGNDKKGEFGIIEKIKAELGTPSARTLRGIGDDAAVLEAPKGKMLFCSDAMVEGIHFDLAITTPFELGYKALASCLSDIAAMNGRPLYAVISIALPQEIDSNFVTDFYKGAAQVASECGIDIVGGDTTRSPKTIFVDVSIVGETEIPALRSGAEPGDYIAVSGTPGKSAVALVALQNGKTISETLRRAHLQPKPRFDLLAQLPANLLTSLIDISDGVSNEINHIAEASQVGFNVDARLFPLDIEFFQEAGSRAKAIEFALSGGEDFELLATFDRKTFDDLIDKPKGFTVIGTIETAANGRTLIDLSGARSTLEPTGYNHFAPKALPETTDK